VPHTANGHVYAMQDIFDRLGELALHAPEADWTPQMTANLLNAYARVERRNEVVVRKMCRELVKMESAALDIQSISQAFHAIATLHIADTPLICKLALALSTFPPAQCSPQSVANIAWSYAVMRPFVFLAGNAMTIGQKKTDDTILQWIWDAVAINLPNMDRHCLSQLHQLLVTCQLDSTPLPASISEAVVSAGRKAFRDNTEALKMVSTLQNDVAQTLRHMGYEIQEEVIEKNTGYSLDIWIPSRAVVVEVDGPFHFCHGTRQPLGRTVLKHRHLRNLGYALVTVPYFRWRVGSQQGGYDRYNDGDGSRGLAAEVGEECVKNLSDKAAYLEKQIETAVHYAYQLRGSQAPVP
jgi:hypothetical protein